MESKTDIAHRCIASLYSELEGADTSIKKSEYMNSIIQIRIDAGDLGYRNEAKKFLLYYFQALEERDFGYDHINWKHLVSIGKNLDNGLELGYFKYFDRLLRRYSYDQNEEVLHLIRIYEIKASFGNRVLSTLGMKIARLLYYSTRSISSLVISILLMYTVHGLLLLPSPLADFALFSVDQNQYVSSRWQNYLMNLFLYWIGSDKGLSVVPSNFLGAVFMLFGYVANIVLIVSFFYEQLIKRIER